jgi:hypothetical protein
MQQNAGISHGPVIERGLPTWPTFEEKSQKMMIFDKTSGARQYPNPDKLPAFDAYCAKQRKIEKTKK